MDYKEFIEQTNRGWGTYNVLSLLSHVKLPYGFSIHLGFKDFSDGAMLREAFVGRKNPWDEHVTPGLRSWDGTYTSLRVEYRESVFTVESAVEEDQQYILVIPEKVGYRTPALSVEACLLWGKEGVIGKQDGRLFGQFPDGTRVDLYSTTPPERLDYAHSLSPAMGVYLYGPTVISTKACTLEEGRAVIARGRAQVEAEAARYGKHEEAYTAMKSCLAWDTFYDCEHDRLCSPVSRSWSKSWGGYVMFCWDSYFAALMAAVDCPSLAYANAIAITEEATERGFVPNFACAHNVKSRDRSEPPVGSAACLSIYRRYGGEWFLAHVYDTLLSWNRWNFENRRRGEGYLCWGSDAYTPVCGQGLETNNIQCWQGAAYESGLDNSPMYDGAVYDEESHLMLIADVGLMGLYIEDCRALLDIGAILGRHEADGELTARQRAVENALETLWSEEDGIYENRDLATGALSRRISPTNFYALYSDRVTEDRARRMCREYYFSPDHFYGEYRMPSISRSDPAYPDQNYWRGRIWAPMNYLVYEAMKRRGCADAAKDLAEASERLLLKEWRLHGHVHENYNADTGLGCGGHGASDPFYHWGGLLALIAIEEEKEI